MRVGEVRSVSAKQKEEERRRIRALWGRKAALLGRVLVGLNSTNKLRCLGGKVVGWREQLVRKPWTKKKKKERRNIFQKRRGMTYDGNTGPVDIYLKRGRCLKPDRES